MTLLAIADDATLIGNVDSRNDILISCGDLSDAALTKAIDRYQPRKVFAVRGNHDPSGRFPSGVVDLHLRVERFEGLTFGGLAGCWRYKPRGHHLFEQDEVVELMISFPPVDVLVAHNSPAGYHERDQDVHQGFIGLKEYIARCQPRLLVHGHQHVDRISLSGKTTIVGVFGERLIGIGRSGA